METKSVSIKTGEVIDAQVIEEDGKVYLAKEGEKYLVEKDTDFYRLMTRERFGEQVPSTHIGMYISGKCNMNCPFCYENKLEEPTFEEIKKVVSGYNKKPIVLGGLEPTLREDIFDIIRFVRKRNYPFLATNGLLLADYDFVLKLKEAGLFCVIFAFNDWSNPLKVKALENLKKAKMRTMMSVMLSRGVNDDHIKKIYDYCVENRDFITELRFRAEVPTKKHWTDAYCMSEMLELVADKIGVSKDGIMSEYLLKERVLGILKRKKGIYARTLCNYFRSRLCSFYFTVNNGKSVGEKINIERIHGSNFWVAYYLLKAYGIRYILEKFTYPFVKIKNRNTLQVLLRRWSDPYTIDLTRNKECVFRYYRGDCYEKNWGIPFCYSMCDVHIRTYKAEEKDFERIAGFINRQPQMAFGKKCLGLGATDDISASLEELKKKHQQKQGYEMFVCEDDLGNIRYIHGRERRGAEFNLNEPEMTVGGDAVIDQTDYEQKNNTFRTKLWEHIMKHDYDTYGIKKGEYLVPKEELDFVKGFFGEDAIEAEVQITVPTGEYQGREYSRIIIDFEKYLKKIKYI